MPLTLREVRERYSAIVDQRDDFDALKALRRQTYPGMAKQEDPRRRYSELKAEIRQEDNGDSQLMGFLGSEDQCLLDKQFTDGDGPCPDLSAAVVQLEALPSAEHLKRLHRSIAAARVAYTHGGGAFGFFAK